MSEFLESTKKAKEFLEANNTPFYLKKVEETQEQREMFVSLGYKVTPHEEFGDHFYVYDSKTKLTLNVHLLYYGYFNFFPEPRPKKHQIFVEVEKEFPEKPRNVKKPRRNAVQAWFEYYKMVLEAYEQKLKGVGKAREDFDRLVAELAKTSDHKVNYHNPNKHHFTKGLFELTLEFDETRQYISKGLKFHEYQVKDRVDFFKKL